MRTVCSKHVNACMHVDNATGKFRLDGVGQDGACDSYDVQARFNQDGLSLYACMRARIHVFKHTCEQLHRWWAGGQRSDHGGDGGRTDSVQTTGVMVGGRTAFRPRG